MIAQERKTREEIASLLSAGGYGLCRLRAEHNPRLSRLICDEKSGTIVGGLSVDSVVMPGLGLHPSLLPMAARLAQYSYEKGIPYALEDRERAVSELDLAGHGELARTLEGL
jgi:hypothetical protein